MDVVACAMVSLPAGAKCTARVGLGELCTFATGNQEESERRHEGASWSHSESNPALGGRV